MNLISNQFNEIFEVISSSLFKDLKKDLFELAVRYSRIRVDWILSDNEQRLEMEDSRTRCHNAFIDACNILSRNMDNSGENAEWREKLGNDRKVIGDFACFIHYKLGIEAK